jgi:hypothetical protein
VTQRLGGIRGLGYTLLGTAVCAYAVAHYALWILPRRAWLRWQGLLPPPDQAEHWTHTTQEGKN